MTDQNDVKYFEEAGDYIITPPGFFPQRDFAGQALAAVLKASGYVVETVDGLNNNAVVIARNQAGARIDFFVDPITKEIQIKHARPFKRWVPDREPKLAVTVLDLAKETSRAQITLDYDARQVEMFAGIDLGNFNPSEVAILIERRWQEIARLFRDTQLVTFVMPLGMANNFAAEQKFPVA